MVAVAVPAATTPLFPIALKSSRATSMVAPLLMVSLFARVEYSISAADPAFKLKFDQANDEVVAVRWPPAFTWRVELAYDPATVKVAPETFIVPLTAIPKVGVLVAS